MAAPPGNGTLTSLRHTRAPADPGGGGEETAALVLEKRTGLDVANPWIIFWKDSEREVNDCEWTDGGEERVISTKKHIAKL